MFDNPTYYTKHQYSFLRDELQRHTDDLNWALNKKKILKEEFEKIPWAHVHKRQAKSDELISMQNQIDSFQRLKDKAQKQVTEYEETHKTLMKKKKWARGAK